MATPKSYGGFASVARFSEKHTLDPSSINAASVSVETFAVAGLEEGAITLAELPDLEAGVVLVESRCAANDVLTLVLWNTTGGAINPASQAVYVMQL